MGLEKIDFTSIGSLTGSGINDFKKLNPKEININIGAPKIDTNQIDKKDLKQILEKFGEDSSSQYRKNIESLSFDDKNNTMTLTYKNAAHKKIINQDLSYTIVTSEINEETNEQIEINK